MAPKYSYVVTKKNGQTFEKKYRDAVGKAYCEIAKYADTVERIFCGLGQRIK